MPSRDDFEAEEGGLVAVWAEFLGDLETPVSAYLKLAGKGDGPAFLLESVEGGEKIGRYSFIGWDPVATLVKRDGPGDGGTGDGGSGIPLEEDPLAALEDLLSGLGGLSDAGARFLGGAVGYIGYDCVRFFEKVALANPDDLGLPEAAFMVAGKLLVFDHVRRTIRIVVLADTSAEDAYDEAVRAIEAAAAGLAGPLPPLPSPRGIVTEPESNMTKDEFEEMVRRAKEYIRAGDIFQVVLSQRFSRPVSAHPIAIYRALRAMNPSPYMFFFRIDGIHLIGSSPEVMVRLEGSEITLRPIAGTRPRGSDAEEDRSLERDLLSDEKELAEHIMLVDLGRNDVGRVAETGSVEVSELKVIERYSHVMHIVSNVKGRLSEGKSAYDLLRATFPAGTVSGAPKVRAMEIIDELEPVRRGPYAGALGYFSFDGNSDTAIILRTIIMDGETAHIQAGAGIVADSVPEREYIETVNKARAMMKAIEWAEAGLE